MKWRGWRGFPHYRQLDAMDCGPTCLRMIAKHYGREYSLERLRELSHISRQGVSMLGISEAARAIGMETVAAKMTTDQLAERVPLPCILHWQQRHFVVLYGITERGGRRRYKIADPATKKLSYSEEEMRRLWVSTREGDKELGAVLAMEPGPDFAAQGGEGEKARRSLRFFLGYLRPYRREVCQLILGMIVASALQLAFPFLTQALVDVGIKGRSVNFIMLILAGQIMISVAQLGVEFLRSWLLLHINARVNIKVISDFLVKLMKLPLSYFDSKNIGDIMQRIGDHQRIESFLTGQSVGTLFSMINFVIFAVVLGIYNMGILGIFLVGNGLYVGWVSAFMKYRRELDIRRFAQSAEEQSSLIQLITGMQEIKLNNCEKRKRWQWERIQVNLFRISVKGQAVGQIQQVGSIFFNQMTNVVISFIAAKCVVEGSMTLGMMVSLTYIVGALNGPVNSFIGFIRQLQDAKISLERLNEIHCREDEEQTGTGRAEALVEGGDIRMERVWFSYDGAERNYVLKDVSLTIPAGKVTAIVGSSGGGKTTLMKLLLGFYKPLRGEITVGGRGLEEINPHTWRGATGAVMQEGFIFSDSIAGNIAMDSDEGDMARIAAAAETANLREFVDGLPLGYHTKIGMEGNGISQGQRQRILIARTVYKNPRYIFFDEATNALDANNEREIMGKLKDFYRGRTVVVVAHRLSTVRDADNIVVLDKGEIAEQGTHAELIARKGLYYTLIKNQLELGS